MSGAYTFIEVLKRLHPRYLFEESRGQLVDAFWGAQDLGQPDLNDFTGQPHMHHPTTGQPFDPDVHCRHPWDRKRKPPRRMPWQPGFWRSQLAGYSEVEDDMGMKREVARSGHSDAAHKHFTAALRKIGQLDQQQVFHAKVAYDPENRQLDVESLDSAEQERNREIALGFGRYLLHRHRGAVVKKGRSAADSTFSNAEGLRRSRRTIRTGTFNLLARTIPPWRSELELVNNWLSIFFLVYTLFFQVRGCQLILRNRCEWWSFVAPPLPDVDEAQAAEASLKVYAILFLKEIYPVLPDLCILFLPSPEARHVLAANPLREKCTHDTEPSLEPGDVLRFLGPDAGTMCGARHRAARRGLRSPGPAALGLREDSGRRLAGSARLQQLAQSTSRPALRLPPRPAPPPSHHAPPHDSAVPCMVIPTGPVC